MVVLLIPFVKITASGLMVAGDLLGWGKEDE